MPGILFLPSIFFRKSFVFFPGMCKWYQKVNMPAHWQFFQTLKCLQTKTKAQSQTTKKSLSGTWSITSKRTSCAIFSSKIMVQLNRAKFQFETVECQKGWQLLFLKTRKMPNALFPRKTKKRYSRGFAIFLSATIDRQKGGRWGGEAVMMIGEITGATGTDSAEEEAHTTRLMMITTNQEDTVEEMTIEKEISEIEIETGIVIGTSIEEDPVEIEMITKHWEIYLLYFFPFKSLLSTGIFFFLI